ncbi:MAG: DUF1361 domain-containing protein [Bacteroidia bacterium]|nr:DUF1361 domain-containing protein [Bacteroidia bacterium]
MLAGHQPLKHTATWLQSRYIALICGTVLALLLLLARMFITDALRLHFLVWNLILAWIPWLLSEWIVRRDRPTWLLAPVLVAWLLFFPNAPYIITDFYHLRQRQGIPVWFDLMLIFTFAWTGLMLGLQSLHQIYSRLMRPRMGKLAPWALILLLLLTAYGVYAGRFMRLNSWEIATAPTNVAERMTAPLLHPRRHREVWAFTGVFAAFMGVVYVAYANNHRQDPQ